MGDTFFNVDPDDRPAAGDVYTNTRFNSGGDVWFDVLDDTEQDFSWATLNCNHKDFSWHTFAYIHYIQLLCIKPVDFVHTLKTVVVEETDFYLKDEIGFDVEMARVMCFTHSLTLNTKGTL